MGRRTANIFLLSLGAAAVLVGVLYLGGCFAAKMSAARTAELLRQKEGAGTWKNVTCRPFSEKGSYWDYTCRVESMIARPFSFEVRVSGSGITDQSGP